MQPTIDLAPKRVRRTLIVGLLMVLAGHLFVVFAHFVLHWQVRAATDLFDMDIEANLPTFYNAFLFFIAASLLYLAGLSEQGKNRRAWNLLALIFVFLGFDEASQIHEKLIFAMWRLLDHGQKTRVEMGWLYHAWVIPYGLALIALLAVLVPFLIRMSSTTRNGLIVSGAVYLTGAVLFEMWGGRVSAGIEGTTLTTDQLAYLPCMIYPDNTCALYASAEYVTLYTIEETLEMLGLILSIQVLMTHLGRTITGVRLEIRNPQERAAG